MEQFSLINRMEKILKFEQKYPDAGSTERFEFEYSYVTKTPKLAQCNWCGSFTKWIDILFQVNVCSEECNAAMWSRYRNDQKKNNTYENFEEHFSHVRDELSLAQQTEDEWKDILIVVYNQLDYLKECIESIQKTTKKYHLYIWDNGSNRETEKYIEKLVLNYNPEIDLDWRITTVRSERNTGFIFPNNELVALGTNPYIILLNSDTKVFEYWDRAMIGKLVDDPDLAQVGFWGGHLGSDGRGFGGSNGDKIDYVPGWCFCIRRSTYEKFGLFDGKNLKFAYCEDSDFSLRLKEAGHKIYALYAPLVHHHQNKTVVDVEQEGKLDLRESFDYNHEYIKKRWHDYLQHHRVLIGAT